MVHVATCPECGAEVAYSVQEARVLTGTCGECHRVTTLVQGGLPLGTPGSEAEASATEESSSPPAAGPECATCGEPLVVTARDDGTLQVECAECGTRTTFVPAGRGAPRGAPEGSERYRPRGSDEGREGGGPSRSRPCRQCGAPLTFTTDDEGNLTGECASCGNRFTLPPRRDGGPSRDRGGYGAGRPSRYGRGGGGWSGGGKPRYRERSGGYRAAPRRRESDEGDGESPRRRRPRRE